MADRPSFEFATVSAVTDRVWIGGDLSIHRSDLARQQADELVEHGLTHVVDCRSELDDAVRWRRHPAVDYLNHPMDDAGQEVPDEWFDEAVEHLQTALLDPAAVVLTHCHAGVNRGPSLGFALLLAEGWDPVEAIGRIRSARLIAHTFYAEQALRWHHERTGTPAAQRRDERAALTEWRRRHPVSLRHVMGR